jgi:hypothetical protein
MTPKRLAGPARPTGPSVSVVIAAYSSDRWAQLRDAVASVGAQHRPALEAATGDRSGALRSAAIIGGFGLAAAGFAVGCLSAAPSRRTGSPAPSAELAVTL